MPIISAACTSVGVSRATYYRWLKDDPNFSQKVEEALRMGRPEITDMAEGQLIKKIQKGDMRATTFWLTKMERSRFGVASQQIPEEEDREREIDELLEQLREMMEATAVLYKQKASALEKGLDIPADSVINDGNGRNSESNQILPVRPKEQRAGRTAGPLDRVAGQGDGDHGSAGGSADRGDTPGVPLGEGRQPAPGVPDAHRGYQEGNLQRSHRVGPLPHQSKRRRPGTNRGPDGSEASC